MSIIAPQGAQYFVNGLHYKAGRHGYAFYWCGDEWLRSSRSVAEIDLASVMKGQVSAKKPATAE